MLQVINLPGFKKDLENYIDGVTQFNNKVIVHANGKSLILMPLEEYEKFEKIDETEYLLGNDANKAMLEEAMKQINEGKTITIDINDLEKLISQNIPNDDNSK